MKIETLTIVTSDRPERLHASLESYAGHLRSVGRACSIAVMDDSKDSAAVCANQRAIEVVARRFGMDIRYAGTREKALYVNSLRSCGIPRGVAEFALFGDIGGSTTGANRNAALLHSIGDCFLCSDDDVICNARSLSGDFEGLALVNNGDAALECFFFASRREAIEFAAPDSGDLFARHERLLGQTVIEVLSNFKHEKLLVESQTYHSLSQEPSLLRRQIPLTLSGVVGDSGMPTGALFMTAKGATRGRFLQTFEHCGPSGNGKEIYRVARRFTIARNGLVMTTTATGLDNRVGLPPFSPSHRSQDSLFGATLARCCGSWIGHIPVALVHDADLDRSYKPIRARPGVARLITELISSAAVSEPASALRELGASLRAVAAGPVEEFAESVFEVARRICQARLERYRRILMAYRGQPETWAKEMRLCVDELTCAIESREALMPVEFSAGGNHFDNMRRFKTFVDRFGELLIWWPAMLEASAKLRRAGRSVATRVDRPVLMRSYGWQAGPSFRPVERSI
jgi:hypothetical protein